MTEQFYDESLALIIATNYSNNNDASTLICAEEDAIALADALRKHYGFATKLLLGEDANASLIRRSFMELTIPRIDGNNKNRLIVFIAGHGNYFVRDEDWCFVPDDWHTDEHDKLIREDEILEWLTNAVSRHFYHSFLIVDACFSGGIGRTRAIDLIDDYVLSRKLEDKALHILTAGGENERIRDCVDKEHSAMARILLETLIERPEQVIKKGLLTSKIVSQHVEIYLRDILSNKGIHQEEQMPCWWPQIGRAGDMIFLAETISDEPKLHVTPKVTPLVELPPGQYPIGCDPADADCFHENETPFNWWILEKSIWVGTHPITVEEYRLFIEDGGYKDDMLWKEEDDEHTWFETHGRTHLEQPILSSPDDYPISGICWFEARAYSNWLSRKTNHHFRLLTEVEWEASCRGKNPRQLFPWKHPLDYGLTEPYRPSREDIISRCHGWVIGLPPFATTSVHEFDGKGTSWCGCEDMVGNVYEWTSSLAWAYPYSERQKARENPTRPGERVLRGGSLQGTNRELRCAHRWSADPWLHHYAIGFRIATSEEFGK